MSRKCRCASEWTGVVPAYGLSAYAITRGGTSHPHDPSDLCRCLYVSPSAPTHMRERSPEWASLVDCAERRQADAEFAEFRRKAEKMLAALPKPAVQGDFMGAIS